MRRYSKLPHFLHINEKRFFMSITKVTDGLFLAYIEAKLDIDGSVRPNDLRCQFKMDRGKASKLINRYCECESTSGNVEYKDNGRHSKYIRTSTFKKRVLKNLSSKQLLSSIIEVYGDSGCSTKDVYLKFIDAYVELHDFISPVTISNQFGMHRSRAGHALKSYKEDRDSCSNLRYHLQGQMSCYRKTTIFKRCYLPKDKSPLKFIMAIDVLFGPENMSPDY